MNRYKGNPL